MMEFARSFAQRATKYKALRQISKVPRAWYFNTEIKKKKNTPTLNYPRIGTAWDIPSGETRGKLGR